MPETFSTKLERAFTTKGQLCIGIDPHSALVDEAGFEDDAGGVEHFSMTLLDQVTDHVGIIKPQVSFFERFGSRGFAVLERLLSEASNRKLLVIADAKRGDIGSTMDAYSAAWLTKSAPFICDGLTVSPYLGFGALNSAIAEAIERGKGLFVLCATSNPEGRTVQEAIISDKTISESIAQQAITTNSLSAQSNSRFGNLGLVIGATVNRPDLLSALAKQMDRLRAPILAPGFGAQGAKLEDLKKIFSELAPDVICSVSREVLVDGLNNAGRWAANAQTSLREALAG